MIFVRNCYTLITFVYNMWLSLPGGGHELFKFCPISLLNRSRFKTPRLIVLYLFSRLNHPGITPTFLKFFGIHIYVNVHFQGMGRGSPFSQVSNDTLGGMCLSDISRVTPATKPFVAVGVAVTLASAEPEPERPGPWSRRHAGPLALLHPAPAQDAPGTRLFSFICLGEHL